MEQEESCFSTKDREDWRDQLSRPLETRLHSRVMATAYKYKLMAPEEDGERGSYYRPDGRSWDRGMKVCIIILVIIVSVLLSLLVWKFTTNQQVCLTPECVEISAYILKKMKRSVDPCQDFYQYACGGWESSTFVPPNRAKYDTFAEVGTNNQAILKKILDDNSTLYKGHKSTAVAKLKLYYRTCMDIDKVEADGTAPMLKKIEELGSWSIAPRNTTTTTSSSSSNQPGSWDLVSSLISFERLGQAPLFSFSLMTDHKNSSRFLMGFSQSGLTLNNREEYLEDPEKFKVAFLKFAVKVGRLLGGDDSTGQKMEAIYNFEKQLAQIFMKKEDLQDPLKTYNLMTVADFQHIIGDQVSLKRLMSGVMGQEVEDSDSVMVTTVDYFTKLGPLLANTSQQVLQDYMVWHMVQRLPGYLPQAFTDAAMDLNKVEYGTSSTAPRWQRCIGKAESAFGYISAALYVDKTFPPESKAQALKILSNVQSSFIDNLDTVPWMDQETKVKARSKAIAMEKVLGYPEWLMDPVKLDAYYQEAEVKEGEFLDNFFAVAKYEMDRMWKKKNKSPNKDEWSMLPDEVNAYFSSTHNQIVIMAGLLQRPYFDPAFPMSFAYGAMGMICGHELTHGFDNNGRKFDERGDLEDWWTNASSLAFTNHSQCMVQQYSNFTWNSQHINGQYTLGENIADNGGLKLGYAAYMREKSRSSGEEARLPGLNLTTKQLFFVGFSQIWCAHYTPEYARTAILTDEHAISKFRVLGSVANMPQFAEAFNCPASSPLHPPHTCKVW